MNSCCKEEIVKVLEWLYSHGHGGGNWRRIILMKKLEVQDAKESSNQEDR